jgi:O-antigen/teichoic acid export membrane protein
MTETTLKEKVAKGIFWGGISNFVQQAIGAVFGIVIARLLSPGDYGLVGMLSIFTVLGNTICESGFTTALTNRKEIKQEDYSAVFWFSLTAGVVMYLILFFCAPFISRFYGQPELTNLSRLVFLNFMLNSAGTAHFALMFKKLMVKERAKIDITAISISGLVGLILALNGFSYWGLALQTLSFTTVSVILRWHYSQWKPTLNINTKPLREMFWFSFKLFLTNIFMQISSNIFSVLLGRFYDEKQVGYYSQGNKWMMLGSSVIGGMIASVAQPIFVESKEDRGRLLMIFRKMLRFGAFVSFPSILGLAFIGKEFILITLGEKWLGSVPYLQILCIWGAFAYLWAIYTYVLMSYGKSDVFLYGNICICVLQLIVATVMFPFGIFPMVTAYTICYLIGIGFWHYFVNKLTGLRLWLVLKDILPYLGITLGCFMIAWIVTYPVRDIYLLLVSKVSIVVALYILIMRFSGSAIFKESMEFVQKLATDNIYRATASK